MALASTSWKPGHSGNPNTPSYSPELLQQFLDLLEDAHPPTQAARLLGHRRQTFSEIRDRDSAFAKAWDQARSEGRADWYEARLRGKASGEEKGDTLADIVGAKMTGRFVEPQYQQHQVNVQVNLGQLAQYSADELRAMLQAIQEREAQAVEGEVRELPALEEERDASE